MFTQHTKEKVLKGYLLARREQRTGVSIFNGISTVIIAVWYPHCRPVHIYTSLVYYTPVSFIRLLLIPIDIYTSFVHETDANNY